MMITEETFIPQDNHINKFYSAILFKCAEEGYDLHCAINARERLHATLNVWHYKKKKKKKSKKFTKNTYLIP